MPIEVQEGKTPKGQRCLRAHVSGPVSLADAEGMGKLLDPGQPYAGALVYCFVAKGTEYSPESRKYFGTMNGKFKRMAAVVPSAVVRAAINFMIRLTNNSGDLRMFNTEADAMAFLDS